MQSSKTDISFLREKYLSESLILNSKIPNKVIIRTGIVFGTGYGYDRFIKSILRLMQYPGSIQSLTLKISPLHIDDVVEMLEKACSSEMDSRASVCEVSGEEEITVDKRRR